MKLPLLHGQLSEQLGQWIVPQDQRHLTGFSEIVAAILQSGSAAVQPLAANSLAIGTVKPVATWLA